jgi:glycosyltransferase involved in cell wall biosynthesis
VKPARVLVAHPFPDVYGADRVLLDAVLAFRDAGMLPTVVLPEPGPMTAWLDERGLPYRCVDTPVLRKALLRPKGLGTLVGRSPNHFSLIARTIAELEADIVYANTVTLPHWVLGARRARIPVVVHAHESDARMRHVMAAALAAPLLAATRIVAVSNAAKAFLCRTIPRLRDRIDVVYNGLPVPADEFPQPLADGEARMAVIGRLNPNKGQDLAIATTDALVRRGRDVRLEIAGDTFTGYEHVEVELRDSVRQLGLEDRVTFAGFCADIWELLRRTDIVLAPSRTDSLPLVVIEAMLARRPIVAADVGGMPELIDDGVTGMLVPREDVGVLTSRIEALLDDPAAARRLGDQARAAAVDRFGSERFRREIVGVVESVLASAGRPSSG